MNPTLKIGPGITVLLGPEHTHGTFESRDDEMSSGAAPWAFAPET
jgi:hypothetical protein